MISLWSTGIVQSHLWCDVHVASLIMGGGVGGGGLRGGSNDDSTFFLSNAFFRRRRRSRAKGGVLDLIDADENADGDDAPSVAA